ncbi:MAG: hypothetical protein NWQ08_10110 [Porticoccaceae bacterium]|nr:hypothetical protein [Porticoccaceae bacterium]
MAAGKQSEVMGELDGIIAGNYERQDTSRAKAFKAELLLGDGEREAALALVNDILKTDNNFEQALLVRAHYHILADDIDSAVSDLRVVLRNNSESEQALVMLANAYLSSGSSQLADDIFRKVLDINPGNVHAAVPVIQSLLEKKDMIARRGCLKRRFLAHRITIFCSQFWRKLKSRKRISKAAKK